MSRPNAKYSSIVPVPTVARVWPCRSPQNVRGSADATARIRFDSTVWPPLLARMRVSAPASRRRSPLSRVTASSPLDQRTLRGRPSSAAPFASSSQLAVEALARVAPHVLGLDERIERLARANRGRRDGDEAVERATDHVEARGGRQHRVELGAERIDEDPPLAALLAERLGARAGAPRRGIADRHVDAIARRQRAVGDRDDQRLEPRPHLTALLDGEIGDRRRAGVSSRTSCSCGRAGP